MMMVVMIWPQETIPQDPLSWTYVLNILSHYKKYIREINSSHSAAYVRVRVLHGLEYVGLEYTIAADVTDDHGSQGQRSRSKLFCADTQTCTHTRTD